MGGVGCALDSLMIRRTLLGDENALIVLDVLLDVLLGLGLGMLLGLFEGLDLGTFARN